jgi:hypothetical protein
MPPEVEYCVAEEIPNGTGDQATLYVTGPGLKERFRLMALVGLVQVICVNVGLMTGCA